MSGKQRQGPQPAPRRELGPAESRQAAAPGNPARPAQDDVSGSRPAGSQAAQGHPLTPGAVLDGNGSHVSMNHLPGMAREAVTLTASTASHTGYLRRPDGSEPRITLAVQDASRAGVPPGFGHPDDFSQPPGGAAALAGHEYGNDYFTAGTNPVLPAHTTPARPEAPAGHTLHREPGELQAGGRPGHGTPPGWAYATRSPGDVGPFG
jgi:hypothetical protein